jgi:hypothetical protein
MSRKHVPAAVLVSVGLPGVNDQSSHTSKTALTPRNVPSSSRNNAAISAVGDVKRVRTVKGQSIIITLAVALA